MKPKITFRLRTLFFLLSCCGLLSLPFVALQLNPSRNLPGLSISFSWPDTSPNIIESEVTSKIEAVCVTLRGLKKISSRTGTGQGEIYLVFDSQSDIDQVNLELLALLRQIYPELPPGVSYPIVKYTSQKDRMQNVLSYNIYAPVSALEISNYINKTIRFHLAGIPEIEEILPSGAPIEERSVIIDRQRLARLDIPYQQVQEAINTYFTTQELGIAPLAYFSSHQGHEIAVQSNFTQRDWDDFLEIPLKAVGQKLIRLEDVASLKKEERYSEYYTRVNGENAVGFSILATDKVNHMNLADQVDGIINDLRKELPRGWELEKTYDASTYLKKELHKLWVRSLVSIGLLLLFVIFIFRSLRYTLLIFISVLTNILIAVLFIFVFKIEINLFSLAGAAFSIGILIDNTIVMMEHWRLYRNRRAFLSILGATLTTISVLGVLFFVDEQLSRYLIDFVLVIIANLAVSLFSALFFIPSLMAGAKEAKQKKGIRKARIIGRLNSMYKGWLRRVLPFRKLVIALVILLFGLPLFLLPESVEKDVWYKEHYNASIGSEYYQSRLKPLANKWLGGTFYRFISNLFLEPFDFKKERLIIHTNVYLPPGHKIQHIDGICRQLEQFLDQFPVIDQFVTTVHNKEFASIKVYPKEAFYGTEIPYELQDRIQSEVLSIGSAAFSVFGVGQSGFGNRTDLSNLDSGIKITGYNKNQLEAIVERERQKLEKNKKCIGSRIVSERSFFLNNKKIFAFDLKAPGQLARYGLSRASFYEELEARSLIGHPLPAINLNQQLTPVRVSMESKDQISNYLLNHQMLPIDTMLIPLKGLIAVKEKEAPEEIIKENQLYQLILEYSSKGSVRMKKAFHAEQIEKINKTLPLGFRAVDEESELGLAYFRKKIWILIAAVLSVFIISATLLNSFRQALLVISFIPVSYIGIFLTYYWFDFKFDLGGIVSFLLISGVTVNSVLYLLTEFNQQKAGLPVGRTELDAYLKAVNAKVIPIFLTIISTILGFMPFVLGGQQELFWFSLAIGTIGGLVISLFALILFFPLCLLNRHSMSKMI